MPPRKTRVRTAHGVKYRLLKHATPIVCAAFAATLGASLPLNAREATGASVDPVMSASDIAQALKPAVPAASRTRGLARRPDTATLAPAPQPINLKIDFEYNSSALKPEASAQLKQLQLAFTSEALLNERFAVAGHTDSKGNAQYNKQLSLKRAEAVKRFLVANGVTTDRLDVIGYGSERPLMADHPDDAANRRVEIRDLGATPPAH